MGKNKDREMLLVLLILATAIFFRFWHLDRTPPGLYPDEAMNGSNALVANETSNYQVFYPENNGREGLFINLQALSVKAFGIKSWALRGVSAIIGVLTVLGLYLLARELFDHNIAALSAFLMAVSFWHVNFSRIGFRAIMLPFVLVYGFWLWWRGLKHSNFIDFAWAGAFFGLGVHTYTSYRVAPLIVITALAIYWAYLKKDFSHERYLHTRNRLLAGFVLLVMVAVVIALPMLIYLLAHQEFAAPREGLSVLAQAHPWRELAASAGKTLTMFNFTGDWNQRHNVAGMPMLSWPIGVLFIIGFFKELGHWLERKHGHFSPVHTLLFTWFFIMLLPGMLSLEAPHAIRTIGILPVVMLFAGRGLWWLFKSLGAWSEDIGHAMTARRVLVILLAAIAIFEFHRYFVTWAGDPATAGAFNTDYVAIAGQINRLPESVPKYIIVRASGVIAYGQPIPAQTVMFLTKSVTPEMQRRRHITYLSPAEARRTRFERNARIFELR